MSGVRLKCTGAQILYYEPGGLLLSASLLPVDDWHGQHLLAFQLSYLGVGDLTVQIALTDGTDPEPVFLGPAGLPFAGSAGLPFAAAVLRGSTREAPQPSAWLSSLPVADDQIDYRLTIRSECCTEGDGGPCGELIARIAGYVPLLSVAVRTGAAQADATAVNRSLPRRMLSGVA